MLQLSNFLTFFQKFFRLGYMRHLILICISLKCILSFAVTATSNSPYSPHRQLSVLVDDMQHLKQEVEALKQTVSMTDAPILESNALLEESQNCKLAVEQLQLQTEQQAKLTQDNFQQIRDDFSKKYGETDANVNALKLQVEYQAKLAQDSFQQIRDDISKKCGEINELKAENESLNKEVVEQKQKNDASQAELEEQKSKICKLEEQEFITRDTGKQIQEALEKKITEYSADLLKQCQKLCADTINQTNDRLQDLARQVQEKIDQLKPVEIKHTISSGESLSSIARHYNTTAEAILKLNNLSTAKTLRVGDTIWISK